MDGSKAEGDLVLIQTFLLYYVNQVILMLTSILMSNFLDIDFVMKLNAKRSRRFDLSEAIFKCE